MARSEDIKTPPCRLAFTKDLFIPQEKKNGKKQYGGTLLFPKTTDLSALQQLAVDAAVAEWGDKAVQWIKDGLIKNPFLDGDGKQALSKKTGERHAGFAGNTFIRLVSGEEYKPKIYDKKRNPVMSVEGCPSGSQGFGVVNAFTWENDENGKGVSFGVSLVQVVKVAVGDEILGGGGGADPDKYLDVIEDEGDAPAEVKTGKGAAGLFG